MFNIGSEVEVVDVGLARLRAVMAQFGDDPGPNNIGRVVEIMSDGDILVEFPIDGSYEHSQVAPYPPDMVQLRVAR